MHGTPLKAGPRWGLEADVVACSRVDVALLSVVPRWNTKNLKSQCGGQHKSSQVKLLLPKFHRNRTRKYYNTALCLGGCWVSLTGRFHRHSAAGWAECTVAGPGRVSTCQKEVNTDYHAKATSHDYRGGDMRDGLDAELSSYGQASLVIAF